MVSVIYTIYIKIQGPYVDFAVKKIQHRSLSERKCINQLYEELQTPYCFFVSYTLFPSLHGDDLTLARNQGHVSGRYLSRVTRPTLLVYLCYLYHIITPQYT